MTFQTTLENCKRIIAEKHYSRHSFVADIDRIQPTRERLGQWALQKYFQVYLQNRIFSAIHANTEHEDIRQFMMEQLIAEETALTCGTDSHYGLMRRFAEACGVERAAFGLEGVSEEVRNYTDRLIGLCKQEHPVIAMLVIFAIETQSGESAGRLLNWLRDHHGFSKEELEWFTVHSEEDDDHADEGVRLVEKYAHEVDDFGERAPEVVADICDAWLRLHSYYLSFFYNEEKQEVVLS